MRTVGIIAEYDPFHCGHAYHLKKAREEACADYVVAAMSPDFVQRGAPALTDKWTRARMALEAGADLVLELPIRCATGSAEFFANGAVRLLDAVGCVDALSFGCESAGQFALLQQAARFFSCAEPAAYSKLLKERLREGISYPKARAEAFARVQRGCRAEEMREALSRPNNILAVEYQKALLQLGSRMEVVPVERLGEYHASACSPGLQEYVSASAIRAAITGSGMKIPEDLRGQLPTTSLRLLEEDLGKGRYVTDDDLDLLLHHALLEKREMLQDYLDVDEELANRIRRCLRHYTGFSQFALLVQSKQYTLARIRRALLHVLLSLRKKEKPFSCVRVLGFRREAQPLLHRIREKSSIPLSTGMAFSDLPEEDIRAAHLWEMLVTNRTRVPLRQERQRQVIVME